MVCGRVSGYLILLGVYSLYTMVLVPGASVRTEPGLCVRVLVLGDFGRLATAVVSCRQLLAWSCDMLNQG